MPIGILSDSELEEELRRNNKSVLPRKESHPVVVDVPSKGRAPGDMNVPDSLRQIIGEEALLNGRASALSLAKDFGISPSSVSAYTNGATSTTSYHSPSNSILGHINKSRERAVKKAQKTLNGALNAITQEKLDYTDPKDLASIAKDMTVVIKNLEPERVMTDSNQLTTPQFVIFAPTFRTEQSFGEIIDVKE